jgi:glucokinase
MSTVAIGIDLGGTRIKTAAIDDLGNTLQQLSHPTNDGDHTLWKNAVATSLQEIQNKLKTSCTTVGISAPGLPNSHNSAIAFMPGRLEGLENFEWTGFLKIKTFVLNDAIAAMMAEARFGAARNKKNVIMLTLGTGVGGAILIEGKPYQGAFNKAGHIGHMVIDSEGEPDIIGMPGSLEDAIGNCSIEKRSSGKFNTTHQLLKAYREGDSFAASVWLTSLKKLAIGLAALTNILSPEMIILGGGITEAGKDLFEPLEEFMGYYEWRTGGNKAEIVTAQYGEFSGAVGAACFASEAGTNRG